MKGTSTELLIYTDGAARGNPGPAGAGVLLKEGDKAVKTIHKYLGETTNNVAEYSAAIFGLQQAIELGYKNVALYMDSELVARQLKGEYRVKDENMKALFNKVISLINSFDNVRIVKIDREENKEADKLANKAINLAGLNSSAKMVE
jgi:ribonuclease HI